MVSFDTVRPGSWLPVLLLLIPLGCNPSAQTEFVGERIPNSCGSAWPVCQTFAGCVLDDTSYTQGNIPGSVKFIVNTLGAATIQVSMFLTSAQAEGTLTAITVFEPGCGVQYRTEVMGKDFFAESESENGQPFNRSQQVSLAGDHLIQVDSDATASYLLAVTVTEAGSTN